MKREGTVSSKVPIEDNGAFFGIRGYVSGNTGA